MRIFEISSKILAYLILKSFFRGVNARTRIKIFRCTLEMYSRKNMQILFVVTTQNNKSENLASYSGTLQFDARKKFFKKFLLQNIPRRSVNLVFRKKSFFKI